MKKNNCLTSVFFSLSLCFVFDGAAFAEEDGDVLIDSYADEKSNTMDDKMLEAHKIESDIDVSLNLEAESQRGK